MHDTDPIFIADAGLVLTAPFLPHFFGSLGMLTPLDGGATGFRDDATVSRAVHLLRYLVDGINPSQESKLPLEKVLCGLPVSTPVEASFVATESERELSERLLKAMIANWPALSASSVAALRETFLLREGRLTIDGAGPRLQVQRKTIDVLVDQLPWTFSVIKHSWMSEILHVRW